MCAHATCICASTRRSNSRAMPARRVTTNSTLEARWCIIAQYVNHMTASYRSIAKAHHVVEGQREDGSQYIKNNDVVDPETRPGPRVSTPTAPSTVALHMQGIRAMKGTHGNSVKEAARSLMYPKPPPKRQARHHHAENDTRTVTCPNGGQSSSRIESYQ